MMGIDNHLLGNWCITILGTNNYLPIWRKNLKQHKYNWYKHDGSQVELFGVLANGCAIMLYGWGAQLLQRNLMPWKLPTFCAINKSFDWCISYHGGPRNEHFVVMAVCVEELMDQMFYTCEKSCAITTWHILYNQTHLIGKYRIVVDQWLNFLVYWQWVHAILFMG